MPVPSNYGKSKRKKKKCTACGSMDSWKVTRKNILQPEKFKIPEYSFPDKNGIEVHEVYLCRNCGHFDLYGAWINMASIEQ